MMRMAVAAGICAGALALAAPAQATAIFQATLTGAQEVPPVVTDASGTVRLELSSGNDRLEIFIELFGLDLDGNQTPDDLTDNVTGLHIHAAPAGVNGGVVFGLIGPNNDLNGDLLIEPVAGTAFSAWDADEGNAGTTLTAQLPALFSEGLYVNVHTVAHPAGEIRGQIVPVPEPGTLGLLAAAALGLALRGAWPSPRRRRGPATAA